MKHLLRAGEWARPHGVSSLPQATQPRTIGAPRRGQDLDVRPRYLLSAADLEGDEVRNPHGQTLGHIEEILLDVPAGRIAFAVLACSSGERSGDRLCAVPWGAFTYDANNKCFVLEMSRECFAQAPGFDKRDWQRLSDPRWIDELNSYYGTEA